MASQIVTIPVNGFSDGDINHRPPVEGKHVWTAVAPDLYLEKVAKRWMEDTGQSIPGVKFRLNQLPAGYQLFSRPRLSDPKIFDRYLFGHPTRQYFDSPNQFYPHFRFLMDHPNSKPCACDLCRVSAKKPRTTSFTAQESTIAATKRRGRPSKSGGSSRDGASKPKGRPRKENGFLDETGLPDVYTNVFVKLHNLGEIYQMMPQRNSMDWRTEQKVQVDQIKEITERPSYLPRPGELVLWYRNINGQIAYDPEDQTFKIYNNQTKRFEGYPPWQGGVIAAIPEEPIPLKDLLTETHKHRAVNSSGFRVECFPDPNGCAKGLSKQYSYIPTHQIRPFSLWKEVLNGIPEGSWHASIHNTMIVMSSLSTISPFHIQGKWPDCNIKCRGLFLGSELLWVGDIVRMMPPAGDTVVTDVLKITDVVIQIRDLKFCADGRVDMKDPTNMNVVLGGYAYTIDPSRSYENRRVRLAESEISPCMLQDQPWYHMERPSEKSVASYFEVLGRCYEPEAMLLWCALSKGSMKPGVLGLQKARVYSAGHDARLTEGNQHYFWGDFRAQALDIETLNGFEIGDRDTTRDHKLWSDSIKVIDGELDPEATIDKVDKPPLLGSDAINKTSSMVLRSLHGTDENIGNSGKESRIRMRARGNLIEDEVEGTVHELIGENGLGLENDNGEEESLGIIEPWQSPPGNDISSHKKKRARMES